MKDVPEVYMGKKLQYVETYRCPYNSSTREEAEKELERMRLICPSSKGWLEIRGYVEEIPKGYRAVLMQAKYS